MHKLVYLMSSVDAAENSVDMLKQLGIDETQLSVMAKDSIDVGNLPDADVEDRSDVIPAVKQGTTIGGVTGLVAGDDPPVEPPPIDPGRPVPVPPDQPTPDPAPPQQPNPKQPVRPPGPTPPKIDEPRPDLPDHIIT